MKITRLFAGFCLMTAAFVATNAISFATPDMAKKEKKTCVTCHVEKMPKKGTPEACKLTDEGKKFVPKAPTCKQ